MGYNSQHDTSPSSNIDPAGVKTILLVGKVHVIKDHDDLKELSHIHLLELIEEINHSYRHMTTDMETGQARSFFFAMDHLWCDEP